MTSALHGGIHNRSRHLVGFERAGIVSSVLRFPCYTDCVLILLLKCTRTYVIASALISVWLMDLFVSPHRQTHNAANEIGRYFIDAENILDSIVLSHSLFLHVVMHSKMRCPLLLVRLLTREKLGFFPGPAESLRVVNPISTYVTSTL